MARKPKELEACPYCGTQPTRVDIDGLLQKKEEWPPDTYMGATMHLLQGITDAVKDGQLAEAESLGRTLMSVEHAAHHLEQAC